MWRQPLSTRSYCSFESLTAAGEAMAPATCGELVQGTVDGDPLLVTCPIDLYARVRVGLVPGCDQILTFPESPKVARAVRRTMDYLLPEGGSAPLGGMAEVISPIPRGKGMASSSAEIAAACQATARALGRDLLPWEIARLALSIEPTDGVMFPGVVRFDHLQGRHLRCFGEPPPIDMIVLDLGGEVDTVSFNRAPGLAKRNLAKEPEVREALDLVSRGFQEGDPSLIGRGATLSALAHQSVLPKKALGALLDLASELGAIGVNIAHSGTVAGLLFDARRFQATPFRGAKNLLRHRLEGWIQGARVFGQARLISGGVI